MTVVIITHEMDVVRRICDRVVVLDHGRIVESGDVAEVFLSPAHHATAAILSDSNTAHATHEPGGGDFTLTLVGAQTHSSLVSRVFRRHRVDFAILSGRAGTIREEPYLQLSLRLEGGDRDAAVEALRREGIRLERNLSRHGVAAPVEVGLSLENLYWSDIGVAFLQTLAMVSGSLVFTVLFGLPLGIIMFLTDEIRVSRSLWSMGCSR